MSIRVSSCHTYPLKSAKGVSLDSMDLTARGPMHDRMWMLVQASGDKAGRFITQRDRNCEKLALISPHIDEKGEIDFALPDGNTLSTSTIHLKPYDGKVQVWNSECDALDAGDEASQWFSGYLGIDCRLVKMPNDYIRETDPDFSNEGDHVGFADGFPLLVTNTASLNSLSSHFPEGTNVGMERFRPNIVLEGAQAFEEDVMYQVKIGEVTLEFVKPCSRCKIVTIDQSTAVTASNEPLKTLSQVRRGKADGLQGVFFGHNAVPRTLGRIHVGDSVEVLSTKPLHPALEAASLKFEA